MSVSWNYTDWYSPEIKPVHEGPYEVKGHKWSGRAFSWFDTDMNHWGDPVSLISKAEEHKHSRSIMQDYQWRGLKEQILPDDGGQQPINQLSGANSDGGAY